jgi:hypothetical protein
VWKTSMKQAWKTKDLYLTLFLPLIAL